MHSGPKSFFWTVIITTLLVFACDPGFQDKAGYEDEADDVTGGQLMLSLVMPSDVESTDVNLYLGTDATGILVGSVTLTGGVTEMLFEALKEGDYFVTAAAFDVDGDEIYNGSGGAEVVSGTVTVLNILLNQSNVGTKSNTAPNINSVKVSGRTVLRDDDSGLYYVAPLPDEPVTFTVIATDPDGDTLSYNWSVTDSQGSGGNDVGMISGSPTVESITWQHGTEGNYYVHIKVDDGNGGAAAFSLPIRVGEGGSVDSDLDVQFTFNSFPTVSISAVNIQSGEKDLGGSNIELIAIAADPDGNAIEAYQWSTDCVLSSLSGDLTADTVNVVPVNSEECNVTVRVADAFGYNEATLAISISCVPVTVPGIFGQADKHINTCSLQNACVPTQPACVGMVCGLDIDDCGVISFCGYCGVLEVCSQDQTECIPWLPEDPGCDTETIGYSGLPPTFSYLGTLRGLTGGGKMAAFVILISKSLF